MVAPDCPQEGKETRIPALEQSDAKHIRSTHESLQAEVRDGDVYLKSRRKVGAIGVPSGASFYIRPKVECSLLHMLALSERLDEEIVLDSEEASFDIGDSFVDLIAQMFIHEIRRIFQRGLSQQYREQQERQQQLRGRLDLQRQLQQGPGTTTFECVFDELSHDTKPNQLLYHAANILRRIVSNESIAGQLHRYCRQFESAFEPRPLAHASGESLQISHLNRYYERGVELAEFILQEHYVQGFTGQHRDFSSFVVDMPTTFEDAVYRRLKKVTSSTQYRVTRNDLGTLAMETETGVTRDLEPDFIVRNRDTNEPFLVGDIKWKKNDGISRDDLYQMFAYQAKAQAPGLLIYPDNSQQLPAKSEFQTSQVNDPLFVFKLDVSDIGFEQTKKRIDAALQQAILPKLIQSGDAANRISIE